MADLEKESTAHVEQALDSDKLDAQLRAQVADPNIHAFRQLDPPVTPEEEKRVRWKIDRQLPPFLFLIYVITWLDRSNVGNAALMNIKVDLNLDAGGYSLAVAIFFVGACIAESVTNLGMRFVRPSVWVSSAMIIWGGIATLMAAVKNPEGLIALRFFLGFFEAALIAGAPYIFTFWYPRAEWGRRICVYLSATPFAGAFGGWIAYGIAHAKSSIENWRLLFIVEGCLTLVVATLCYYMLPDRPHNTRWLNAREREVAEWRMLRDGNKTHGHFGWWDLGRSLLDWRMMVNIVIYMSQNISTYTISTFTPIIVNSFGFGTVKSQLMVAPPFCVAFVMVYIVAHISDRVRLRAALYCINATILALGYLLLAVLDEKHNNARYGALFLIHPAALSAVVLVIGNVTDNCCGDIKKGCAAGLYQCFGATMGVATGYLITSNQAPLYRLSFWTLFAVTIFGGVLCAFMSVNMYLENKRRDKKYGKPRTDYLYDFSELGEKHPYWRYMC